MSNFIEEARTYLSVLNQSAKGRAGAKLIQRLVDANAQLEKMLELVNDGTIHAGSGLMEGYRALLHGNRVGDIGCGYLSYGTPLEALEAAFVEWEKGEDGG